MKSFKLQTILGLALIAASFGSALAQIGSPAAAATNRPTGFLDAATETTVRGWACIPNQPFRPLFVQILVDNRVVGTTVANANRPDVAGVCGGIGFHGFTFTFPQSVQNTLQNGQTHTVQVFTLQTIEGIPRTQLNGSPATVVFSNTAPRGFLDVANTTSAAGWACDPNNFNTALRVDIYIDNNVFAGSTIANLPREAAVGQQCGGNSNHGWTFTFPANIQNILNNGQPHTVRAYAINIPNGNNPELSGSPKTVQGTRIPPTPTAGPNTAPRGFLDAANTTSASGWACDPNNFNIPLRIDIYIDNNVFAGSTTANLPREAAVAQQCGGNGNHGWTFTFPSNIQNILNNGQPHTVRAYAINIPNGNNPELSGSPKTVQGTIVPPTPSPTAGPNTAPLGFLDAATRTSASGWACDSDNFNTPLRVDIYVNNNVFAGSTTADLPREAGVAQQCGGNANHGWTFTFPANIQALLANGGTVQAYAINTPTGPNPQLTGSPKTV